MNKKISQFELTNQLQEQDLITLVQNNANKNITGAGFTTSLSKTFATNNRIDTIEDNIDILDSTIKDNCDDLCDKIIEGDESVTNNLGSTINSYYDVLNNKIITLEVKHDSDISKSNNTIQEWIDDIDNRSTLEQLQDTLNRLTVAENTITALAELIASGGGEGIAPGYHTQGTSTIFPLDGYYRHNDASPLSTTDTLNQALSKLENQVAAVADSSGSLPVIKSNDYTPASDNSIYTSLKTDKTFIKKEGDVATGKIIFEQGIQGGTIFQSGWDGQGASLYPLNTKWNLELDNLFVRGNLTVNEVTVNEIKAVGGDILVTLGDMKCIKVEILSDGYKCYFDDEDGTKYNSFIVNDMAICQQFDGEHVKRYWRKVNEIGRNFIVLSLDVCEQGSAIPQEGDIILQLGHMVEADPEYNAAMEERRNAIFISAKGANAPRITYYKGIDEFTLADDVANDVIRERVVIGGEQTKFVGTIYQTSHTGIKRVPIYQGYWVAGNTYYYYDQVSHKGSLWICMRPDGTTAEPSDDEDDWQKQVEKGDDGDRGDDVAKWVEITGDRLFLYETADDGGIPTPTSLTLTANTYGIKNPTYTWTRIDTNTIVGTYSTLEIPHSMIEKGTRTVSYRCTVINEDGGSFYDEVQIAKLYNGAEGIDAYYIDLSNGTIVIPYDKFGNPKITIGELYTDIYAYRGITPIAISKATYTVTKGTATAHFNNMFNRVYLDSLDSTVAEITLSITLMDGYTIDKVWYIGSTDDGEDGFDGEDASYVYMTGEQYFHYKSGASVPTPTSITLTADSKNIAGATYKWYYSLAGKYSWNLISGETTNTLVVRYNSTAMNAGDEVTFKCVVTNAAGAEFYDFLTINKVRDGENVYRGSLQNENCSIVTNDKGEFTSSAAQVAKTTSRLKYGNQEITNYYLTGYSTPYYGNGPALVYDSSAKSLSYPVSNTSAFTSDALVYKIDFVYNVNGINTIVDTVDFVISKSKQGSAGEKGNQEVSIYINANSKPARYTGNTLPTGTSGGSWSVDPYYSATVTTWISKGLYNPNTGRIIMAEGATYLWSDPVAWSGKDGENGFDGQDGYSPYVDFEGNWWYWDAITGKWVSGGPARGPEGETGPAGPALMFRGMFDAAKLYYFDDIRRDVIKYKKIIYNDQGEEIGFEYIYMIVREKGTTNNLQDFEPISSFEMIATDMLLAQKAAIAGWQFDPADEGFIYSANGSVCLRGANDEDELPVIAIGRVPTGLTTSIVDDKVVKHINSKAPLKIYADGRITVGAGVDSSNAGMYGEGTEASAIRFWAGNTFANRNIAPFRVNQNGDLWASNADITGTITCNTLNLGIGGINGYNAPGIRTIWHFGLGNGTVVSFGSKRIDRFTLNGTQITLFHNLNTTNYTVLFVGCKRYGDSNSLIGFMRLLAINTNNCIVEFYNSKGEAYGIGEQASVDIILFGY